MGVVIAQSYTNGGEVVIDTPARGLFIVRVGDKSFKVVK